MHREIKIHSLRINALIYVQLRIRTYISSSTNSLGNRVTLNIKKNGIATTFHKLNKYTGFFLGKMQATFLWFKILLHYNFLYLHKYFLKKALGLQEPVPSQH